VVHPPAINARSRRRALSSNSPADAAFVAATVDAIPPPARAISS
jgi:hypothetical protein